MNTGRTFISGIAYSYDETYDEERLGMYLTKQEWQYMMKSLNQTIHSFWPCNCVISIGYCLSIFTLGLSFYLPNLCIGEAKIALKKEVARQNRILLEAKGL